jgi:CRISPR system Cascade subunit CasD
MNTLLLRLAAPLQAWGSDAKFDRRGTERAPTKSGVIGLVAAALGRRRNESVEDLCALRFGVRVDQEGSLLRDYHTAKSAKAAYVTNRYYLEDAVFLVGLEGEEALLARVEHALRHPAFPLFLGRRSCPPEGRLSLGIRMGRPLLQSLREEPRLTTGRHGQGEMPLRIIMDGDGGALNTYFQRDLPLSFDQTHRQFGFRRVSEQVIVVKTSADDRRIPRGEMTEHDPMRELEE